jgi:acyl carrier protein
MSDNENKLKKILADVFKVELTLINEESSVDNIDRWDSLNHLNLVLALELEFNVSFTEEQTVEILNYPLIKIALKEHGIHF